VKGSVERLGDRLRLAPALTVRQPWAWAIVAGHKDVENRRWSTPYRGPLLIHASRRAAPEDWLKELRRLLDRGTAIPEQFEYGAVIGVVELRSIGRDSASVWALPGLQHWQLGRARTLAPIPTLGALGLFRPGAPFRRRGPTDWRRRN
jgi:hypothetical protein